MTEGDDGGVFYYELGDLKPSTNGTFEVTLRVYSFWDDILEMELNEIKVSPWDLWCEVHRDQATNQWIVKGDDIIDSSDQPDMSITCLPDHKARIDEILDRQFSNYNPEELEEIHLPRTSQSIRPYLESLILRLKVELRNRLSVDDCL